MSTVVEATVNFSSNVNDQLGMDGDRLAVPKDVKEEDFPYSNNESRCKMPLDVTQSDLDIAAEFSEPEVDITPDVVLEADAESLCSLDGSENGSENKNSDITYFRFTRLGLSVWVNLGEVDPSPQREPSESKSVEGPGNGTKLKLLNNSTNDPSAFLEDTLQSRLSSCIVIDFQELCIAKYPPSYTVGMKINRFSRVDIPSPSSPSTFPSHVNEQQRQESLSSSSSHVQVLTAEVPVSLPCSASQPSCKVPPVSCQLEHNTTSGLGAARLPPPTTHREDRLSNVIQDILYRLNRQGALANPRDVCRKGGGKSGNYYDEDDDFFDDSLTYEALGLSPIDISRHQVEESFPDSHGSAMDDIVDDGQMVVGGDDKSDDEDYYRVLYDYKNGLNFCCDNMVENDQLCIITESSDDGSVQSEEHDGSRSDETSGIDEDEDTLLGEGVTLGGTSKKGFNKKHREYVSTKYWIRRKAWREYESKLTPDLVDVLCTLETALAKKGTRHGLFVLPVDVAILCRDTVRTVFDKEFPRIAWNSSELIASMYPKPPGARSAKTSTQDEKLALPVGQKEVNVLEHGNHTSASSVAEQATEMKPVDDTVTSSSKTCFPDVFPGVDAPIALCSADSDAPLQSSLVASSTVEAQGDQQDSSVSSCVVHNLETQHEESIKTVSVYECTTGDVQVCAPDGSHHDFCVSNLPAPLDQKYLKRAEKKSRRKVSAVPPSFQNMVTIDDIASLVLPPSLKQLGICLRKMTNIITPELFKRWLILRLVLHNQIVYSALEHRLYWYIMHKSSLFRAPGSPFFRTLKKAVDAYLKSLATNGKAEDKINVQPRTASSTPLCITPASRGTPDVNSIAARGVTPSVTPDASQGTTTTPAIQGSFKNKEKNGKSSAIVSTVAQTTTQHSSVEDMTTKPLPDSPFSSVAKELLNWAIVYNCRRHELKELGETLDEWSVGFATYAVDILNQSIQKKRSTVTGSSTGSTVQQVQASTQRKNRIWVPIKFLEETLARFKTYYGILTLYERRSRKPTVPQFLIPCKGLHPPLSRVVRNSSQSHSHFKKSSTKLRVDSCKPSTAEPKNEDMQSSIRRPVASETAVSEVKERPEAMGKVEMGEDDKSCSGSKRKRALMEQPKMHGRDERPLEHSDQIEGFCAAFKKNKKNSGSDKDSRNTKLTCNTDTPGTCSKSNASNQRKNNRPTKTLVLSNYFPSCNALDESRDSRCVTLRSTTSPVSALTITDDVPKSTQESQQLHPDRGPTSLTNLSLQIPSISLGRPPKDECNDTDLSPSFHGVSLGMSTTNSSSFSAVSCSTVRPSESGFMDDQEARDNTQLTSWGFDPFMAYSRDPQLSNATAYARFCELTRKSVPSLSSQKETKGPQFNSGKSSPQNAISPFMSSPVPAVPAQGFTNVPLENYSSSSSSGASSLQLNPIATLPFLSSSPLPLPCPVVSPGVSRPYLVDSHPLYQNLPLELLSMRMNKMYYFPPNPLFCPFRWSSDTAVRASTHGSIDSASVSPNIPQGKM